MVAAKYLYWASYRGYPKLVNHIITQLQISPFILLPGIGSSALMASIAGRRDRIVSRMLTKINFVYSMNGVSQAELRRGQKIIEA